MHDRLTRSRKRLVALSGLIFAASVLVDQLTKKWIRNNFDPGEHKEVFGDLLQLVHVKNRGVAFGLLEGAPVGMLVASLILVGAVAFLMAGFGPATQLKAVGLGLMASGGVGNAIDRIHQGHVTDFLLIPHWPAFNVADIAISLSVVFIALDMLNDARKTR